MADTEEIKRRFKEKMSGLKLSKKIDLDQAKAIVWMLERYPDEMDCLYKRTKSVDNKKIESQLEQFKAYWAGPRNSGWQDTRKALTTLDLPPEEFKKVLEGLKKEADWRGVQKRKGAFLPEWKNPASWLRHRRWEAEFGREKTEVEKSPGMTAAEITAKMLEERENITVVRKSFREQLNEATKSHKERV